MVATRINLGCGSVFVESPEWINLDFTASSPAVRQANLLGRLPLESDTAQLVYASHFLEHIPRSDIHAFLRECLRVLRPGGVLRLVLPDLEEMARTYLALRDAGEHERADFLVLEIVDQCVRRESGGELGRLYGRVRDASVQHREMIDFISERTGEDLTDKISPNNSSLIRILFEKPKAIFPAFTRQARRYWIGAVLCALPSAFVAQSVSLASVGERHHWLWDFHQLQNALQAAGFADVRRQSASSSAVEDFPFCALDLDCEGRPRKGVESMYIEAIKPKLERL